MGGRVTIKICGGTYAAPKTVIKVPKVEIVGGACEKNFMLKEDLKNNVVLPTITPTLEYTNPNPVYGVNTYTVFWFGQGADGGSVTGTQIVCTKTVSPIATAIIVGEQVTPAVRVSNVNIFRNLVLGCAISVQLLNSGFSTVVKNEFTTDIVYQAITTSTIASYASVQLIASPGTSGVPGVCDRNNITQNSFSIQSKSVTSVTIPVAAISLEGLNYGNGLASLSSNVITQNHISMLTTNFVNSIGVLVDNGNVFNTLIDANTITGPIGVSFTPASIVNTNSKVVSTTIVRNTVVSTGLASGQFAFIFSTAGSQWFVHGTNITFNKVQSSNNLACVDDNAWASYYSGNLFSCASCSVGTKDSLASDLYDSPGVVTCQV